MRADAEANRERLLDAASEIFAERGFDAPLQLVARRAGVGKGTLYRHFEDREQLIDGLSDRLQGRYAAMAEAAEKAPTGWDGLMIYLDGATAMYFDFPWTIVLRARARRLAYTHGKAERDFRMVIERAQAEGSLRPDVDLTDLAFVTSALGGLAAVSEPTRSVVVPRLRDIVYDGLRAEGAARPALGGKPLQIDALRDYLATETDLAGSAERSG
jgi:AcrR family transcriptional regulator